MLPNVVISQAAFDRTFPEPQDTQAFITVAGGPSPATTAELKRALATYPDAKIQTRTAWVTARASSVDQVLDLFYVLLGLSVIISVFGMVNTLVLAVPVPKGSRWFRRRSTDLQRCGGFRFLDPRQRSGPRASSTAIMQHVRSVQRLGRMRTLVDATVKSTAVTHSARCGGWNSSVSATSPARRRYRPARAAKPRLH